MLTLSAKIRKDLGRKTESLRKRRKIPSIIYGHNIKNIPLELDEEQFKKAFKETGESSLIALQIEGEKEKRLVLIHEVQQDPLTDKFLHIDFFQPSLKEEVEVTIPLIVEGTAPAVKELGGTLVKNITEVKVKALPQNLPHEIKINIDGLKTFDDHILIKDLTVSKDVKILKDQQEIVLSVAPPTKVEEELAKPIEEKVEEVEKAEEKKKEEVEEEKEVVQASAEEPKEKPEEGAK